MQKANRGVTRMLSIAGGLFTCPGMPKLNWCKLQWYAHLVCIEQGRRVGTYTVGLGTWKGRYLYTRLDLSVMRGAAPGVGGVLRVHTGEHQNTAANAEKGAKGGRPTPSPALLGVHTERSPLGSPALPRTTLAQRSASYPRGSDVPTPCAGAGPTGLCGGREGWGVGRGFDHGQGPRALTHWGVPVNVASLRLRSTKSPVTGHRDSTTPEQ
mmetsp:Transcript_108550/g.187650  ORF Transcript_108550/g.187650 Transcript_108550/m.187650 type:complete len:211 (-) Transcript_108550:920-1552(-)